MHSNRYIFLYSSIMVVMVAALLSAAVLVLQPYQDKNIRIEKMQQILASANIKSTPANALELYDRHIIAELVVNTEGEILSHFEKNKFTKGEVRAFDLQLKAELKKLEDMKSGKGNVSPVFPVFVCLNENDTDYIFPLYGRGLWGPLWGNIALKNDFKTVAGVAFDHKSETPGLGAEITADFFSQPFVGKTIMDEKGEFVSVKVVKGGVANSNINPMHGVDAISGGTITSIGVSDMLEKCLSNYLIFIKSQKALTEAGTPEQKDSLLTINPE